MRPPPRTPSPREKKAPRPRRARPGADAPPTVEGAGGGRRPRRERHVPHLECPSLEVLAPPQLDEVRGGVDAGHRARLARRHAPAPALPAGGRGRTAMRAG